MKTQNVAISSKQKQSEVNFQKSDLGLHSVINTQILYQLDRIGKRLDKVKGMLLNKKFKVQNLNMETQRKTAR